MVKQTKIYVIWNDKIDRRVYVEDDFKILNRTIVQLCLETGLKRHEWNWEKMVKKVEG
jgi:hypothetical protein